MYTPKGFFEDYEDKRVADALSKVNEDPREDIQNLKNILTSAGVDVIQTPLKLQ